MKLCSSLATCDFFEAFVDKHLWMATKLVRHFSTFSSPVS